LFFFEQEMAGNTQMDGGFHFVGVATERSETAAKTVFRTVLFARTIRRNRKPKMFCRKAVGFGGDLKGRYDAIIHTIQQITKRIYFGGNNNAFFFAFWPPSGGGKVPPPGFSEGNRSG